MWWRYAKCFEFLFSELSHIFEDPKTASQLQSMQFEGKAYFQWSRQTPYVYWPTQVGMPKGAPGPCINAVLARKEPTQEYSELKRIVTRAYAELLTPEWFGSVHFRDSYYLAFVGDVYAFWKHCEDEQMEDEKDLWFNLPPIASALLALLEAYFPGWNPMAKKDTKNEETKLLDELIAESETLFKSMLSK